jgi:uncharacterized SAM-binding protein YcdF (DUF218 family)
MKSKNVMHVKILGIVAGVFIVLTMLYVVWNYEQINAYGRSIKPIKSDAIIVLGAAVLSNGQPSSVLQERLDSALTLYRRHYASVFILTGGRGQGEPISEAEVSKQYLESKGVPSTVMYLDNQSKDTWENLTNAKQIMQKQGTHTAVIVTDFYHQYRAQHYAHELGMNTSGYVGQIPPMTNPKQTLREVVAITLEKH